MERRFFCAKSVACGRVIEREWGNPQRFPPHTPSSLRYARVRTTKPEGNHKTKPHPKGWGFVFGMPRAGLNSLPRPARSASNSEVRQGSCEWLCHSRDAGKRVRASSSTALRLAFALSFRASDRCHWRGNPHPPSLASPFGRGGRAQRGRRGQTKKGRLPAALLSACR